MQTRAPLFTPVLVAGCLVIMVGFAIRASFGVFQIPIATEFGWARADFSLAIAIQNLAWGIGQPIFGALAEKFGDRRAIIAGAITLLIFFVRNFSLREKFRNTVLYGGFALVVVAIFFSLGYTSLFDKYQVLYKNVFNVFIGESPDEASSAVRFMEMNIALDYISKNPLLGNGFISNQWNGGWHDILGYFYPVDIGLLGNIFVFGVIGTTLLYLPYAYSYTLAKQIRSNDVFFKTCEYMLLFFFLSMFFSAVNIRDSSSIMFLVCLLYYFRFYYFTANERAVVG